MLFSIILQKKESMPAEEFQNQMQALEQEQQNIEDFIKSQESKFSLFGWLVKLFNK